MPGMRHGLGRSTGQSSRTPSRSPRPSSRATASLSGSWTAQRSSSPPHRGGPSAETATLVAPRPEEGAARQVLMRHNFTHRNVSYWLIASRAGDDGEVTIEVFRNGKQLNV